MRDIALVAAHRCSTLARGFPNPGDHRGRSNTLHITDELHATFTYLNFRLGAYFLQNACNLLDIWPHRCASSLGASLTLETTEAKPVTGCVGPLVPLQSSHHSSKRERERLVVLLQSSYLSSQILPCRCRCNHHICQFRYCPLVPLQSSHHYSKRVPFGAVQSSHLPSQILPFWCRYNHHICQVRECPSLVPWQPSHRSN